MDKATGYGDPPAPKPPILMYDCYVLSHAIGSDLSNYESYAKGWVKIGQQYDVPVIVVPQAFRIGQRPAANELRAQAYLALAAGCKGINWFRFETLEALGNESLEEIREVNRDLETIGPTLLRLRKIENIATVSGCGGRWSKAGTVNTFLHGENPTKYLFVASKDVLETGTANVSISKGGIGYQLERVLDCHTNQAVDFRDEGDFFSFGYSLAPGQGRLFELEGDPSIPIAETGLGSFTLILSSLWWRYLHKLVPRFHHQ